MIRIAVCDDEVIFVRCLRDMVEALFEKQGMEFQCFVYTNAPELIQAHRKEEFQLLFLDIGRRCPAWNLPQRSEP